MGFQNLRAFNQDMLAKQVWRILSNPTSLVTRVLKWKCFPTGDVLNAKLGSLPSYSWRSIHSSLEVIKNGSRWRVGNGKLIHIWDDRWLPTPSTYKVISPPNGNPEFPMVSALIDPITKWWNVNLVRATFLPFEADTILRIPLTHSMPKDKIIWFGNSRGEFTVKSAYHIAFNLIEAKKDGECSSGDPCKSLWKRLWHLNLPAKVKIFTWRVCANGLPTMEAICNRGISNNRGCPICGKAPESINHAFLSCDFSTLFWNQWPENRLGTQEVRWSFLDSAMFILSHHSQHDLEFFFGIAWAIWYNRNKVVHEESCLSHQQVWQLAKSVVEDFSNAVDWDFSQPRPLPVKWNPPPPGIFKVNVDGATVDHGGNSSVGVIVRDCTGQTIAANCKLLKACYSAELVEIMALLQGVLLAQELHLPQVIMESDALAAIQAINDKSTSSNSGHLIQEILHIRSSFESCTFQHIGRDFNQVAHELAQHAHRTESSQLLKGVTPFISLLIQSDVL